MRVAFFGTPDFTVPVVEVLLNNFELVGLVTTLHSPLINKYQNQVQILTPDKLDEDFLNSLRRLAADLLVVASYGKILPQSLLDIPRLGALNIHFSLLPKYRGASPMQEAILNGDAVSGISILKIDAELDHGPIVYQEEFSLSEQDNFESLRTKMFIKTSQILAEVVRKYASGEIKLTEQDHTKASFCTKISKEDGFFEIDSPPALDKLDRMIRAYHPWPGVWTKWQGKIVKFYPELRVQLEGKRLLSIKEFLNGHPDFPIKKF